MRRSLGLLVIVVMIVGWTLRAGAAEPEKGSDAFASGLDMFGIEVSRTQSDGLTSIIFHCDEEKALAAIPTLQALGVVNPDITQIIINLAPVAFSANIATYG